MPSFRNSGLQVGEFHSSCFLKKKIENLWNSYQKKQMLPMDSEKNAAWPIASVSPTIWL
jgi:hypothetical protein